LTVENLGRIWLNSVFVEDYKQYLKLVGLIVIF
jgi:hypothetical protein